MRKQVFEQTGLVPRSIIRTFDRFRKQLLPGAEKLVIHEFRISKYQVVVSIKCLTILIVIPFLVNLLIKSFFLVPFTEYFWNNNQTDIFLNSYQEEKAFEELKNFEDKLFFEALVVSSNKNSINFEKKTVFSENLNCFNKMSNYNTKLSLPDCVKNETQCNKYLLVQEKKNSPVCYFERKDETNQIPINEDFNSINFLNLRGKELLEQQENFQKKILQLAIFYNQKSIEALTNLVVDLSTFLLFIFLFVWMKSEIIILKSFLTESIYSLSDTTKSFLLILGTDLLVGFHSPRGWEIFLELFLKHFGLPENQDFIFLFVATFPVLLDTVFKYWIFRYLNQISPSTVATYHNMIE